MTIAMFRSMTIAVFRSMTITVFHSMTIAVFRSMTIAVFRSNMPQETIFCHHRLAAIHRTFATIDMGDGNVTGNIRVPRRCK